jgi:aspartate oxidase
MWRDVGIVRDREMLARAKAVLSTWSARVDASRDVVAPRVLPEPQDELSSWRESQELADMLTCARLATEAALAREESRGAHFRRDFPEQRQDWRRHLVWQG